MDHFQHGVVGRLQWNDDLEDKPSRLTLPFSAPTLTCFQLYYCSARWFRRGFHKVTWPSLFLHGVGVTLPWAPVSGDIRKMDGAGDSGMGSLFHLEAGAFSSRSRWDFQSTGTVWLQMQRSYPDQRLLSDVKSRALETSLLKWLCTKHWFPLVTWNSLIWQITTVTMEGR